MSFGWCKPRKNFVGRLIDGTTFHFDINDNYVFTEICCGELYDVFDGCGDINFTRENFYKKFKITERQASCYEKDCVIDIVAFEKVNSKKEEFYLVYSDYKDNYYNWLNDLYQFKKDKAFQDLLDFDNDERDFDYKKSKRLFREFKGYFEEAKRYSKHLGKKDLFIEIYERIMMAFKFASNKGKIEIYSIEEI